MSEPIYREYLGDAVYVAFDGYHIVLTTEDGISATNTIYLEPLVLQALRRYVDGLPAKLLRDFPPPEK